MNKKGMIRLKQITTRSDGVDVIETAEIHVNQVLGAQEQEDGKIMVGIQKNYWNVSDTLEGFTAKCNAAKDEIKQPGDPIVKFSPHE